MNTTKVFSPKDPQETVNITFEFAPILGAEAISGAATSAVQISAGTDAAFAAVKNGAPVVVGTQVVQSVTAGVAGVDYYVTAKVTTNGAPARTLLLAGILPVRNA